MWFCFLFTTIPRESFFFAHAHNKTDKVLSHSQTLGEIRFAPKFGKIKSFFNSLTLFMGTEIFRIYIYSHTFLSIFISNLSLSLTHPDHHLNDKNHSSNSLLLVRVVHFKMLFSSSVGEIMTSTLTPITVKTNHPLIYTVTVYKV